MHGRSWGAQGHGDNRVVPQGVCSLGTTMKWPFCVAVMVLGLKLRPGPGLQSWPRHCHQMLLFRAALMVGKELFLFCFVCVCKRDRGRDRETCQQSLSTLFIAFPSSYQTLPHTAVFSSPSSAHIAGPKNANFWNSSSLLVFILF